jgi:hypothetical protein
LKVNLDLSGANGCLAARLYEHNLQPKRKYFLRFLHPANLQSFLANINDLQVHGQHIEAKIFQQDLDKFNVRQGTLLPAGAKPDNILRRREEYFRDFAGKGVMVLVEGIPSFATLGMITYQMQNLLENEHFEWAYKWANAPGAGDQPESNAVLVGTGYDVRKS